MNLSIEKCFKNDMGRYLTKTLKKPLEMFASPTEVLGFKSRLSSNWLPTNVHLGGRLVVIAQVHKIKIPGSSK